MQSPRLEAQDCHLAKIEVDEVLPRRICQTEALHTSVTSVTSAAQPRLMGDIRSEVAPHHAMPSGIVPVLSHGKHAGVLLHQEFGDRRSNNQCVISTSLFA